MITSVKSLLKNISEDLELPDIETEEYISWKDIVKKYRHGWIGSDREKLPEKVTCSFSDKPMKGDCFYAYIILPAENGFNLLHGDFYISNESLGTFIPNCFTKKKMIEIGRPCGLCSPDDCDTVYSLELCVYQKELMLCHYWFDGENLFKVEFI